MTESTNELRQMVAIQPEEKPTQTDSPVILVWSDKFEIWEGHANSLQPQRLIQAYEKLKTVGGLEWPALQCIEPNEHWGAPDALLDFHHPAYCKSVSEWYDLGMKDLWLAEQIGFSSTETVPFVGMAEVAQQYVSATRSAVRLAIDHAQEPINVVCFAGEQVHARAEKAKNGDIFNDIALALLDADRLAKKVAFINLDAEHPTVIQELFFSNPNVMMISLHEDPLFLYPGTGQIVEIGKGQGRGYNVNIPLPLRAGDTQINEAFEQVINPLLKRFEPNLVIMLGGASAHVSELLSHLRLTTHGYQQIVTNLAAMAPRLVLLGGSGSDWDVCARLWVLALATLTRQLSPINKSTDPVRPNEQPNAFRIDMLHDEPIPALSHSMQEYIDYKFKFTLLEIQKQIFPQWHIPISLDETLILKNMNSLTQRATTENKISAQVSLVEKETSPSPRLRRPDEHNRLTQQIPRPGTPAHALDETVSSEPEHSPLESLDSSMIDKKQDQPEKGKSDGKEGAADLQTEQDNRLASSQTPTRLPQNRPTRPKRLPSSKRKRSRSRRKRSGGK